MSPHQVRHVGYGGALLGYLTGEALEMTQYWSFSKFSRRFIATLPTTAAQSNASPNLLDILSC